MVPSQTLQHLGFILNSQNMTISLSQTKRLYIQQLIDKTLAAQILTIKELTSVIGTMVASFPRVKYRHLFYRELEFLKTESLKESNNYQHKVKLNSNCRAELQWWLSEGLFSGNLISHGNPTLFIQRDSS